MSISTKTTGIHQSDVAVRGGLVEAIKQLRENSWLLDFAFAGLPQDTLTVDEYGEMDATRAKEWFLNTKVPVLMFPRRAASPPKMPCVTIVLLESAEVSPTLADVNYEDREFNDDQPPLTARFDPVSYDPATGKMVLPATVTLVTSTGQLVVDRSGVQHQILQADEDLVVYLEPNLTADLSGAYIVGRSPGSVTRIESLAFQESYQIGCHVHGEPAHLLYLYTVIKFALLVYKESLFEARGFESGKVSASDIQRKDVFGEAEAVFSRYLVMSGRTRDFWPKGIAPTISSFDFGPMEIAKAGKLYPAGVPDDAPWIGDGDADEDALAGL